ncbi:MAG: RES family NAD+ phosphorylase [Pseudomonadota bacterium]|nr:MAG: phosphoanhydride phosphorylase [Pseudomonadota bacterium]
MSSSTWTPAALASEARRAAGRLWRAVEAQHRAATMRLVDSLEEQAQLERLLEGSKPPVPQAAARLHYLLATPFRYPPRFPGGSRFRSPTDPGVFYGAAEVRTACAELGYWRWRFLMDSPALASLAPVPHTLFACRVAGRTIDLRAPPFDAQAALWTAPDDYLPCQRLGAQAREAGIAMIRYRSVRDPKGGQCTAVLSPQAFTSGPQSEQSWHLAVTRTRVTWRRDSVLHSEGFQFTFAGGPPAGD